MHLGVTELNYDLSFLKSKKDSDVEVDEIPFSFLLKHFECVPVDVEDRGLDRYCRAYLLYMLGAVVFSGPGASASRIPLYYLPLLEDIDNLQRYAWGAAMLAQLHIGLQCKGKSVWGPTLMLLGFLFERIPTLYRVLYAPLVPSIKAPTSFPLLAGWAINIALLSKSSYNKVKKTDFLQHFEQLDEKDVIWRPYHQRFGDREYGYRYLLTQSKVAYCRIPLIFYEKVAWHFPNLCPKQLGVTQNQLMKLSKAKKAVSNTRSGKKPRDYVTRPDPFSCLLVLNN